MQKMLWKGVPLAVGFTLQFFIMIGFVGLFTKGRVAPLVIATLFTTGSIIYTAKGHNVLVNYASKEMDKTLDEEN